MSLATQAQQRFSENASIEKEAQAWKSRLDHYADLDSNKMVMKTADEALIFAKKEHLPELEAVIMGHQASVYHNIGKTDKAFDIAYRILKMGDRLKNDFIRIEGRKAIGYLYFELRQPSKALNEYKLAVSSYNQPGKKKDKGYFDLLQNIGVLYYTGHPHDAIADIDTAVQFLSKAGAFYGKSDEYRADLADLYVNLGGTHIVRYNYSGNPQDLRQGLNYNAKALAIYQTMEATGSVGKVLANSAIVYYRLNELSESRAYFLKAERYSRKANDLTTLQTIYDYLRYVYETEKDFQNAYDYREKWVTISDTLQQLELAKNAEDLQVKHNTEKKEQQISILEKDKKLQANDLERQKTVRNFLIGGFLLIALFAVVLVNRFLLIRRQKMIIEEQKQIVEEKNKDITDSINYAQRIQSALLARDAGQPSPLPHFVLFKPKDIVSGDFYWMHEKQGVVYVAVADCTGHGVPGAFLTMLGTSFLDEINNADTLQSPAEILNALRAKFISALSQTGKAGGSKDGMDISLAKINRENLEMSWAGANNPLWLLREETDQTKTGWVLREYKADKQPIGFADKLQSFTDVSIQLKSGDQLYLFSDGYADQFGGPKGKKLKTAVMKQLVTAAANLPLKDRESYLHETFEKWRGSLEQIDDVCVLGIQTN